MISLRQQLILVQQSGQHIDKRHVQNTGSKQLWPHVHGSSKDDGSGALGFGCQNVWMSDPPSNQVLGTGDKVFYRVWLLVHLGCIVPLNAILSTPSHQSIGQHPALLHGSCLDDTELLVHAHAVAAISLEQDSVTSVEIHCSLLVGQDERHFLTVIGWHEELLELEVRPPYDWFSLQLVVHHFVRLPSLVVILPHLLVDERRAEQEPQGMSVVVIVHERDDSAYVSIVYLDLVDLL